MKKLSVLFAAILAVMLVLTMTACGSGSGAEGTASEMYASAEQKTPNAEVAGMHFYVSDDYDLGIDGKDEKDYTVYNDDGQADIMMYVKTHDKDSGVYADDVAGSGGDTLIKAIMEDTTEISDDQVDVDNIKGRSIVYSMKNSGETITFHELYFNYKDKVYSLSVEALSKDVSAEAEEDYYEMIKSIKLD
ncbi:MAG: hypothetical protein LKJ83_05305 [Eubacteriaceae bacterium]|nr:hypothetical protein [Eubacteriaceae bacterium]